MDDLVLESKRAGSMAGFGGRSVKARAKVHNGTVKQSYDSHRANHGVDAVLKQTFCGKGLGQMLDLSRKSRFRPGMSVISISEEERHRPGALFARSWVTSQ